MPTYHYECKRCKHDFEEWRSVDNRYRTFCPACGFGDLGILIESVSIHTDIEPYYDIQLGKRIKSKKHKKEVAKELGLTDAGGMSVEDLEKEADKNKKFREQQWLNERPTEEFLESYHKAKAEFPSDS